MKLHIVLCMGVSKQFDMLYCPYSTHTVTVLYEPYRTVMDLIGQIQYSYALNWAKYTWANTVQLCREFIYRMLRKHEYKQHKYITKNSQTSPMIFLRLETDCISIYTDQLVVHTHMLCGKHKYTHVPDWTHVPDRRLSKHTCQTEHISILGGVL